MIYLPLLAYFSQFYGTVKEKKKTKRKKELKDVPADIHNLQIDWTRSLLHYLGYHLIFTEKHQNEPFLTILSFALLVPTSHLGFVAGFSSWTNFDGCVLKWCGGDGHFISTLSETRHMRHCLMLKTWLFEADLQAKQVGC